MKKDDIRLVGLEASQVLCVREYTAVGECIAAMAKRNIGCVVVIGGPTEEELVGIFTERDLLRKFSKIIEPDHLDYPVRDFMSSPVVTLPVGKLYEAAQLMVERGFRHVVFTIQDQQGRERIAGVVSSRDLMKELVRGKDLGLSSLIETCPRVALATLSEDSRRLFREIFDRLPRTTLEILDPGLQKFLSRTEGQQRLFFDLDRQTPEEWSLRLKGILALEKRPEQIIVLFNPLTQSQAALRALEKIAQAGVLKILEKPVDVTKILELVRV